MKECVIKIAQCIRNYLVLNVFVVLPVLCLVTCNLPEELEFFIDTSSAVSIRIAQIEDNGERDCSKLSFSRSLGLATDAGDGVAARMFFAEPFDVDKCAYKFIGENARFEFRKLSISRHLFLRWELSAGEIVSSFEPSDNMSMKLTEDGRCIVTVSGASGVLVPKVSGLEWSMPSITLSKFYGARRGLIYVFQLLIVILAILPVFARRVDWSFKSRVACSAAIAFSLAIFVCAILPFQTFIANRDSFDIPSLDMLCASMRYTVLMGTVVCCCLLATSFCYGRLFYVLLTLFLVYEYLQTGILSIGFPSLNGDQQFFSNTSLALRDLCVFSFIMIIGLACYGYVKKYVHWIALAVVVLGGASLIDVKGSGSEEASLPNHPWTNSNLEVVERVRYSPDKNVIVLIPDTLQGDVARDVVETCPEIRSLFTGFVGFSNNIGMHEFTLLGLPSLMMGRYYDGSMSPIAFLFSMMDGDSFVAPYLKDGLPVYVAPHLKGDCGITTRNQGGVSVDTDMKQKRRDDEGISAFRKRQSGVPYVNMFDVLTFRLAPFFLKRLTMCLNFAGIDSGSSLWFEATLLPVLEVAPISSEKATALHVFHTNGLHTPIGYSRTGQRVNVPQNYSSMFEQCYFVLDRIGRYMEKLRERGLFDKAFIVISADHGSGVNRKQLESGDYVPGRMLPILWVKPVNNQEPLAFDNLPTSHIKIKNLLVRAKEEDLTIEQIKDTLKTEERFFRQHFTGFFRDWHVDLMNKVECRDIDCPYKGKGRAEDFTTREWSFDGGSF